jgi:hypothetical protein
MYKEIGWNENRMAPDVDNYQRRVIGFNRVEHGHGADLRTTLLIRLAAFIAMIQINQFSFDDGVVAARPGS